MVYAVWQTFYPPPPKANFPPASSLAEAQRQDLEYFRNYLHYNKSYTPDTRAQAEAMLASYKVKAGQMSGAQFELAIASMVALSDNGHSLDFPSLFRLRHNKLPCMLYRFADGYYILRARPVCQPWLGARLVAIDGHAIEEVTDRAYQSVRGPRTHFDQFVAPFYLESPELLNAMGLAQSPDQVILRLKTAEGSTREVPISADPADPKWPLWTFSDRYLSPAPAPTEGGDWKPYLSTTANLPLFISDYSNPFHTAHWSGIFYAGFRANSSSPGYPIDSFIDEAKKEIKAQNPRVVILDLRFDQGGNFRTTAGFMSHVTTLAPSIRRIYVVTSGWTFSAGITSVAFLKDHGGDKVMIVGEPIGDRLRFWSEGGTMTLPNSQIHVNYATGMHDYMHPCWGQSGCFWPTFFFPTHVKSLAPDVMIPYTFADYRALRDPVMDYLLEAAQHE